MTVGVALADIKGTMVYRSARQIYEAGQLSVKFEN